MSVNVKPHPPRLKYHAVSVLPGITACAQALSLKGQRMLSVEAPRLPLGGCSCAPDCSCRFQHHEDRRGGPRRAVERGSLGGAWAYTDRRRARGRRDEDFDEA